MFGLSGASAHNACSLFKVEAISRFEGDETKLGNAEQFFKDTYIFK